MTLNMQVKYNKDRSIKSRGIQWTDATWNPIAGCGHLCSWKVDGQIVNCYAEDTAEWVARMTKDGDAPQYTKGFAHHYWHPERLDAPRKKKTPLKIFVGSMSDVFSHKVPREHIESVLQVIRECPQHTFQMLTKNPIRVTQFELPDNVWLGASMPPDFMFGNALSFNQKERMLIRTLEALGEVKASIKFMSFEPLSWDVSSIVNQFDVLGWAIIGAASSGNNFYPPSRDVFDNLIGVLAHAHIPVFYKGNLESLITQGELWREEFPLVKASGQLELF